MSLSWFLSLGAIAKVLRIVWQDLVFLCKDLARRKKIETTTAGANAIVGELFHHEDAGNPAGSTESPDGLSDGVAGTEPKS